MVFSSTTFLLAFLPLVGILYFICPKKLRNALLLVFSLLFYGWGEPKYILIMLFSTVFDYCNGLAIGHFRTAGKPKGAKAVLVVSVVGNLSILGFFKYTDFAITNLNGLLGTAIPALGLLLPIGISFYTFQTMSYTIDVYRGVVPPQRNIIDFSAYVTLFPQLIAGPIVRTRRWRRIWRTGAGSHWRTPAPVCSGSSSVLARRCCWPTRWVPCGRRSPPCPRPPWSRHGWARWPSPSRSTLTSPATRTWPSVWGGSLASASMKTLTIRIWPHR